VRYGVGRAAALSLLLGPLGALYLGLGYALFWTLIQGWVAAAFGTKWWLLTFPIQAWVSAFAARGHNNSIGKD
jgi:hypothetical protein